MSISSIINGLQTQTSSFSDSAYYTTIGCALLLTALAVKIFAEKHCQKPQPLINNRVITLGGLQRMSRTNNMLEEIKSKYPDSYAEAKRIFQDERKRRANTSKNQPK